MPRRRTALLAVVLALATGTVLVLWSLWIPLLIAAWSAMLARPLHERLSKRIGGRARAAGVVTVTMVMAVLAPLAVVIASLVTAAAELVAALRQSSGLGGVMHVLLQRSEAARAVVDGDTHGLLRYLQRHGSEAWTAAGTAVDAAGEVTIGLVVFLVGFYSMMVDGHRAQRFTIAHSPLAPAHTERLVAAFAETGRGLFIGLGLTALAQTFIAGAGFMLVGVPKAPVLGVLTGLASLVPLVGTGLVTLPVCAVMFVSGDSSAGIQCLIVAAVTGGVDNLLRPMLSRYGRLALPQFVTFIAMLGGVSMLGPGGLLVGPLLVRLSLEGLRIWERSRPGELAVPDGPPSAMPLSTTPPGRQAQDRDSHPSREASVDAGVDAPTTNG